MLTLKQMQKLPPLHYHERWNRVMRPESPLIPLPHLRTARGHLGELQPTMKRKLPKEGGLHRGDTLR
jgi:hypothetical protein